MKKTRLKNAARSLKSNINRFLSIMFIVALGAGFMAGLAAASPDMYEAADRYIKEYQLFDIDIKSITGFEEDDEKLIRELPEIKDTMPARVFDMVLYQEGGSDFTSRVFGFLNDDSPLMNRINLKSGRMPEKEDECVVESIFGRYFGETISIGDTLILTEGNSDYDSLKDIMKSERLTVVGICESPMSISVEGDVSSKGSGLINLNVYVPYSFFTCGYDTDIYITTESSVSYDTFSSGYEEHISEVIDSIRPIGDRSFSERSENIRSEALFAQETLSELLEKTEAIETTEEKLIEAFYDGAALTEKINIIPKLRSTGFFGSSASHYISRPGITGLCDVLRADLDALESRISNISKAGWMYRVRTDLSGFESYKTNVGKVSALAKIFPVFFFIVALLVALTTMTRLIDENRLQTGTLKALGFSNLNILSEYIWFSLLASVAGCIIGFSLGFWLFPSAISSAYKMLYILPPVETPVRWEIVLWVAPVTIISILLACILACWKSFRSMPSALMLPEAPAAGKRIWLEHMNFIWKRLSFTYKVTFRNLFRYKKRFIMTITGVAGCSALLLTGFGVRDSVNDIVDVQFGEIFRFSHQFALSSGSAAEEDPDLSKILTGSSLISSYTLAAQETGILYSERSHQDITLFIPGDLSVFGDYIFLRDRPSQNGLELSDGSLILTEKICEEMNIKAGDHVKIENAEGKTKELKVSAIAENYVYSFAYMTENTYLDLFGHKPEYTTLLVKENSESDPGSSITEKLLKDPNILLGRSVQSLKESFSDSISSINGVIYVLILSAGLLCIVVLYNLINVNICERRKELSTLSVLGFFQRETRSYIFRETNILSFLGALTGLIAGVFLHSIVVRTVEINHIMFGRNIKPLSYLIALFISVVFTMIVDIIMRRNIDRIDMVEAMKANE